MLSNINVQGLIQQKGVIKSLNTKYGKKLVCDVYLVDETDKIKLVLWGRHIKKVKNGDIVSIQGAYTTTFRHETQLNVPEKNCKLEVILDDEAKKRLLSNMSKGKTDYQALDDKNEAQRRKFKEIRKRLRGKKDENAEISIIGEHHTDLQVPFSRPAESLPDAKYDITQESENQEENTIRYRRCRKCLGTGEILLGVKYIDHDAKIVTCPVCNGEGKEIVEKEKPKPIDIYKLKFVTVSQIRTGKIKSGINIKGIITLNDDPQRLSKKYMGKAHDYLNGELTDVEGETITVTFHGSKQIKNIENGTKVRIIGGQTYQDNLIIHDSGKIEILSD